MDNQSYTSDDSYWLRLSKDWQESKLPQKQFCERRNVPYPHFTHWRSRLIKQGLVERADNNARTKSKVKPHFVKVVSALPRVEDGARIVIHLPYGIKLEMPADAIK